jgi:hypothetical protein
MMEETASVRLANPHDGVWLGARVSGRGIRVQVSISSFERDSTGFAIQRALITAV